jgi:hypothetical protein
VLIGLSRQLKINLTFNGVKTLSKSESDESEPMCGSNISFQGHCFINNSAYKIPKLQELAYSRFKLDIGHNLMRFDITRREIHNEINTGAQRNLY